MNASDIMTTSIVTLTPGNSVRHAARLMLELRVSGLPVVDDGGKVVGMVTEGDLIRRAELGIPGIRRRAWQGAVSPEGAARDYVRTHSWRVGDVMSSPVVTVDAATPVSEVAMLLDARGIKRVAVTRDGRLAGIVSRLDLLQLVASSEPEPIAAGDEAIMRSALTRLRDMVGVVENCPTVTVEEGVIHLWGTVGTDAERDACRVAVEAVPGSRGLVDHLTIAAPSAVKA
jgi:CBS domain-containing protein